MIREETHRLSWRIKNPRTRATTRSKIRSAYLEGEATRSEIGSVYSEKIARAATRSDSRRNLSTHSSIAEEEEKNPKSEAPAQNSKAETEMSVCGW